MALDIIRRCVRIIDTDSKKFLGSGFRLSARRVLTCRHVIKERQRVTVLDLQLSDWKPTSATVCWSHQESYPQELPKLDIVLLDTDPIEAKDPIDALQPWTLFFDKLPEEPVESICHIIGFPGGASAPERRETVTVSAYLYSDLKERIHLKPHGGEPEGIAGWRGLSGSPVLNKDSKELVGILVSKPSDYANRKLWAVPIPSLRRLPDFCSALEIPALEGRVLALLERSKELLEGGLRDELAKHHRHWQELHAKGGSSGDLSKAICLETDLEEHSMALLKALESALEDGREETARKIYEFVRVSLPAAVLRRFETGPPDAEDPEIRVPAVTKILIEISMAGIDGRPLWVREPTASTARDVPQPVLNVSLPEETSIDPEGRQKSEDLVNRLCTDLGIRNLQGFPAKGIGRALDFVVKVAACQILPTHQTFFPSSHLDDLQLGGGLNQEALRNEVSGIVDEQLAIEVELKRRCYIVADQSDQEFMAEVRRRLPHLGRVYPEPLEGRAVGERRTNRLVQRAFACRNQTLEQES